ncbi:MAG: Rne/Rng family ribonuclease [Proteobacteria bacterium]|nr:Rne/Rng family ribonuclease [Pseudomonadota bacterium]
MAMKMLIEAVHPEETRVVVVKGQQLEEFDFEATNRAQLKGNIYLAKVTRVEPSLQAAFIEYGGNRHGFLSFNEIHPDYYQIPVADRQALLAAEAKEQAVAEAAAEAKADAAAAAEADPQDDSGDASDDPPDSDENGDGDNGENGENGDNGEEASAAPEPEALGGDEFEEEQQSRRKQQPQRSYKIQEVIKRRQILLVQVVKEERGNKGAALTTYISLAGRYCVLMPNTARGGGISRKIVSAVDRKRLKSIVGEISIPKEMALIVRTAGAQRSKPEIKRDYDYLSRLWTEVRDTTLQSVAPTLVHEEANLIKRAIRDLYSKDVDEVLVEGDEAYKSAKKFMRMLMPSHAKRVQPYKESIPLFRKYDVDAQLDSMMSTRVTLKSGGYIIINSTEALVAIDVNSGRSTRERNIEETAVKTNLEAAQEIARQLRLRDLAGLIVIDFIDMEDNRNNRSVERKIKDWLKFDRARIQVGRISHFGLMEMSRQRLRPSLLESSSDPCPTCGGSGIVYSVETAAMRALRALEDEALRGRSTEVSIFVPTLVALYILNQKRSSITSIEGRYGLTILVRSDDTLIAPDFRVERGGDRREPVAQPEPIAADPDDEDDDIEVPDDEDEAQSAAPTKRAEAASRGEGDDEDQPRKRRRRGRRGGRGRRRDADGNLIPRDEDGSDDEESPVEAGSNGRDGEATTATAASGDSEDGDKPARPRRRRGGRGRGRRSERPEGTAAADGEANGDNTETVPEGTAAAEPNAPESDVAQAPAPSDSQPRASEPVPDVEPVKLAAAPETTEEPKPAARKPTAEPAAAEPEDPSQPKKRGWWSRALS